MNQLFNILLNVYISHYFIHLRYYETIKNVFPRTLLQIRASTCITDDKFMD